MKQITRKAFFGIVSLLSVATPSLFAESRRRPTATPEVWHRSELYFGSLKPDGTSVSEEEFSRFLDDHITPRFPDGLTLLVGLGQFRISLGATIREKSMVLILFYPPQMVDANQKIQDIRRIYKDTFQQESVLRADSFSVISL